MKKVRNNLYEKIINEGKKIMTCCPYQGDDTLPLCYIRITKSGETEKHCRRYTCTYIECPYYNVVSVIFTNKEK